MIEPVEIPGPSHRWSSSEERATSRDLSRLRAARFLAATTGTPRCWVPRSAAGPTPVIEPVEIPGPSHRWSSSELASDQSRPLTSAGGWVLGKDDGYAAWSG